MVDFPEPDNPMMTNISPSSMARLAFFTPRESPVFYKNDIFRRTQPGAITRVWKSFFLTFSNLVMGYVM